MPFLPRRRALAAAAALSAAALLAAGCSAPDADAPGADGEPTPGGTLVYASGDAEPDCLDPHVGGNYPQALLATQVLEQLVSRTEDGEIVPWLAESWELSEDGLALDVVLDPDATFTDGTPVDADAVRANVEHLQDPETGSSTGFLALERVTAVETVEERTARFVLDRPDSSLLESLSQPWLAIQSPAGLERGMEENCRAPIGTGPFVIDEWVQQDRIELSRNGDYATPPADGAHEGPAYLDGVTWRFIPEPATRYAALQSGEVDIIDNAQPDTIVRAEEDGGLTRLDAPRPGSVNRIELNGGRAPFDDQDVREAFIRSFDADAAVESLFQGTAERSTSPLASVEPDAVSEPERFVSDQDEAERLLDEAGWTERDDDGVRTRDGERLTLRFPVSTNQSIPAEQSLFEQVQAGAGAVGFDVQIELLDLPSWYAALGADEYELVSAPYTKVGPDVLRILYHSDSLEPAPSGYFANHAQVSDPALDDLLDEASETPAGAERSALYEQAQERLLAGDHILPLYDQQNQFLVGPDARGVRATGTVGTPWLGDAWLAR